MTKINMPYITAEDYQKLNIPDNVTFDQAWIALPDEWNGNTPMLKEIHDVYIDLVNGCDVKLSLGYRDIIVPPDTKIYYS